MVGVEVGFRWRSKGVRKKEIQGWNKVVTVVEWIRRVVMEGMVDVLGVKKMG